MFGTGRRPPHTAVFKCCAVGMRRRRATAATALTLSLSLPIATHARTKTQQGSDSKAASSCESTFHNHECSAWPPQQLAANLKPALAARLRRAVADVMAAFPAGVAEGQLARLMRRPCMQRLCLHIQLVDGALYVIAPEGMETCARGASLKARLSCPPHQRTWAEDMKEECRKRVRSKMPKVRMTRSYYCNETARKQQPGVTIPGFFHDFLYPHTLEWHFSASLNLSSCRATGEVPLAGDHNHVYTRLRLQTSLRMLLRAYQRLYALGRLKEPMELILCPNETPVNFGDWCVSGAQPIFAMTSNEQSALIPFVQWVQGPDRDADLAWWNPAPRQEAEATGDGDPTPPPKWEDKKPMAVFRGTVHRLNVYTDRWRKLGAQRTSVTASNWHLLGRTALIMHKLRRPDLFNVRLFAKSVEADDKLPWWLGISNATWWAQDMPEYLKPEEQQSYRYSINVEGHGGWADRGYKLLLQPQLSLMQDMPALPWYLRMLKPYEHYVPVESNLRNLTEAVLWAREHDEEARRMVAAANALTRELVSPPAMFRYAEEVLLGYSRLMQYKPVLHERAAQFVCEEVAASARTCQLHKAGARPTTVKLGETRCYFRAPRNRGGEAYHHTLYEASLGAGKAASKGEVAGAETPEGVHSPSVVKAMGGRFRSED